MDASAAPTTDQQRHRSSASSHHHRRRASRSRSRERTSRHGSHGTGRRSRSRSRDRERRRRSRSRSPRRPRETHSRSRSRSRERKRVSATDDNGHRSASSSASSSSASYIFHAPPSGGIPIPAASPLPIHAYKSELRAIFAAHQVVILVGETGSGKSTQICQFLYEFGYSRHGVIGVTQPRRIGAVSLAKRVAHELQPFIPSSHLSPVGQLVGYTVRFEDVSSPRDTQIKFLTDGCLLREVLRDPSLSAYSVIVLDEAHERALSTDVLFGVLKRLAFAPAATSRRAHPLRIVVTSATLDTTKFCAFFRAPLVEIPGRCFPVREIFLEESGDADADATVDERYFVDAAVARCLQIHTSTPASSGHILCFLTGADDVEQARKKLEKKLDRLFEDGVEGVPDVVVLGLYATLPAAEQQKAFAPVHPSSDTRKIVFATNIAETSVTVDGIAYVVDCGLSKQKEWDAATGMHTLQVRTISQTSAKQRMGRAGRTREGVCYRLYTRKAYDAFHPETLPEIQRTQLASTLLTLKTLQASGSRAASGTGAGGGGGAGDGGVSDDLFAFEFIDRPSDANLSKSLWDLVAMEALTPVTGELTPLGRVLAAFPLEPTQAKLMYEATKRGCVEEMLTVVAMASLPGDTYAQQQPPGSRTPNSSASSGGRPFDSAFGDAITSLFLYESARAENFAPAYLERVGLSQKALKQAQGVRAQLDTLVRGQRPAMERVAKEEKRKRGADAQAAAAAAAAGNHKADAAAAAAVGGDDDPLDDSITAVRKCIAVTYFHQLARLNATSAEAAAAAASKSSASHSDLAVTYRPYPEDTSASSSVGNQSLALDLGLLTTTAARRFSSQPQLFLHPSCALFSVRPPAAWVVYTEVVTTTRAFLRGCTRVDWEWVARHVARMKHVDVRRVAAGGRTIMTPADGPTSGPSGGAGGASVAVESEVDIAAREARELADRVLTASKAQVDAASVADAKARYLQRKAAQQQKK